MIDPDDLRLIAESAESLRSGEGPPATLRVVVSGCAYSCCGRGWVRRDGYEQTYYGYVDNFDGAAFMLYSLGIGTISYVVALRTDEVVDVSVD